MLRRIGCVFMAWYVCGVWLLFGVEAGYLVCYLVGGLVRFRGCIFLFFGV